MNLDNKIFERNEENCKELDGFIIIKDVIKDIHNYAMKIEMEELHIKDEESNVSIEEKLHDFGNAQNINIEDGEIFKNSEESDGRSTSCTICGKIFACNVSLIKHQLIHAGEKTYKCDICEISFAYHRGLKRHLLIHNNVKNYKCNVCKKSFIQLSLLKKHQSTHSGEKAYKCDICKKSFICAVQLQRHNLIHTCVRNYKCDICHKSFTYEYILKKHKLRHDGIKNYKCDVCEKSFICADQLKRHNLIHTGVRNYKCDICYKSFIHQYILKRHQLVHNGIKNYKCDVCEKSFTQFNDLKKHRLIHTYICEKLITQKLHLKHHQLTPNEISFTQSSHLNTTETEINIKDKLMIEDNKNLITEDQSYINIDLDNNFIEREELIIKDESNVDIKDTVHFKPKEFIVPEKNTKDNECSVNVTEKNYKSKNTFLKQHQIIHNSEEKVDIKIESEEVVKKECTNENISETELVLTKEPTKHNTVIKHENIYECKICKKSFDLPSKLKQHDIMHSYYNWKKRFLDHTCTETCKGNFCDKLFAHLMHNDEKNYKCNICEKSFKQLSLLMRHRLIHISTNYNNINC